MNLRLLTVLAALVVVLAGMLPASAHAYIVDATPAAGATQATAPRTVRIEFDEPVGLPNGPAIAVVDGAGRRVDKNDAAIDPNDASAVIVHLMPLTRGSYEVRWRVVSADTHVVHGTYAFGYGAAASTATPEAQNTVFDPSAPLASVLRWLALTGIVAAGGALAFAVLLHPGDSPEFARAALWQTRYGSALVFVATAGLFVVQSAASAGSAGGGIAGSALASTARTPFGTWALARMLAVALIVLVSFSERRFMRAIGALCAAVALVTVTLSGHATGVVAWGTHATLELADWLHVASAAAWIGGLAVLVAGLARARAELIDRERRAWLERFTRLAVPCALLTVLTGTYATLAHEPHITLLLSTNWGVVLAVKIALVAILLVLGAMHLRAGRGAGGFRPGTLIAEVVLALVILLATGVLVGQSPPECMFMPPGSSMPPNAKMPPGMQMC